MFTKNGKITKLMIICTALFVLTMNILGQLFWLNITSSRDLSLLLTIATLISHFVLLALMKDEVLLKIGFYYWLYVLVMEVAMKAYMYYYPINIVALISGIFLLFRARTYWLFSTCTFFYLPGFGAPKGFTSKESLFSFSVYILFMVLYGIKKRKVATV